MVRLDQPRQDPAMLKFNADRPPRFRAQYRIRNWCDYDTGLKRRGELTLWLDEVALAGWHAPRRTTPGGQASYSDLASSSFSPYQPVDEVRFTSGDVQIPW